MNFFSPGGLEWRVVIQEQSWEPFDKVGLKLQHQPIQADSELC